MTIAKLDDLAALLRAHSPQFRDLVHRYFFDAVPQARQSFPMSASKAHGELAEALAYALSHSAAHLSASPNAQSPLPETICQQFAAMGRAHRRHGFPASVYEDFGTALHRALNDLAPVHDITAATITRAEAVIDEVITHMRTASEKADLDGIPPAHLGQVVGVDRVNSETKIVRLDCGLPVDYAPGQYFSVSTSTMPGIWRTLSPARPSDGHGTLEFHVRDVSHLPGAIGYSHRFFATRVGDTWTLGSPSGLLALNSHSPSVIVAFGTAVATARSLLCAAFDSHGSDHASVDLFVVNDYPGEHYDHRVLRRLENLSPWLQVTELSRHDRDPYWLYAQRPAPVSELTVTDDPESALSDRVNVSDREIMLLGPPTEVNSMFFALLTAGAAAHRIHTQRWRAGSLWNETEFPL